jgi:hypothetical protein
MGFNVRRGRVEEAKGENGVRWVHHVNRDGGVSGGVGEMVEFFDELDLFIEGGTKVIFGPAV